MQKAAIRSPFALNEISDNWIEWRKNRPLLCLKDKEPTDGLYPVEDVQRDESKVITAGSVPYIMPVHRPQYNAVLDRFAAAKRRSGAYSVWTT